MFKSYKSKRSYKTRLCNCYRGDSINLEQPNSKTRRGRVGHQIANTLTTSCNQGVVESIKTTNKGVDNMWNNNLEKLNFEMEEIKILSLFSGIGAFEKALNQLGIENRIVNFAEIDIDAIISYGAIHIPNFENIEFEYDTEDNMRNWLIERNIGFDFAKGKSKIPKLKKDKLYKLYKACILGNNLGDVSLIKHNNKDIDLIVGGSPCQDFSIAGKMKGSIWFCRDCNHEYNPLEQHYDKRDCCPKCESENLDKTRSSLLVEYLRSVREIKPKYFVYENVKNIKGKNFISMFNLFEKELEEYGYNTYNEIVNSKNYGIPQNRERMFVVGIRKDIINKFNFNKGFNNDVRLKDVLESVVDEKYYINTYRAVTLIDKLRENGQLNSEIVPCDSTIMKPKVLDVANYITARYDAGIQNKQSIGVAVVERIGGLFDDKTKHQTGSVWNTEGLSPTLDTTMQGGYREPCIVSNGAIRGRYNKEGKVEQKIELRIDGISNTLTSVEKDNIVFENSAVDYRIRKLTPLECWRLQGFEDKDLILARNQGVSDSQLYKQAGNSITINVLYYIFKNLFKEYIVK